MLHYKIIIQKTENKIPKNFISINLSRYSILVDETLMSKIYDIKKTIKNCKSILIFGEIKILVSEKKPIIKMSNEQIQKIKFLS